MLNYQRVHAFFSLAMGCRICLEIPVKLKLVKGYLKLRWVSHVIQKQQQPSTQPRCWFQWTLFSIVGKGSLKFYVPFCFSLAKAAKFQKWRSRQSFSPDILGSEVRLRSPQRSQVRDPAQASGRRHRPGGFVTGRNRTLDFTRLYSDIWVKMRSNDEVIHLGLIASSLATSEHPKIPDFHGDSIKQLSDYPGKSLFSMGKLTINGNFQ